MSDSQSLSDDLKRAMRRVAATVNVVSICVDGRPMGITATAVSSISLDPPSLLVCINVLHRDQEEVARIFSDSAQHALRFVNGWDIDCAPAPRLIDAQATILCRRSDSHSFGTHSIFIGVVEAAWTREDVDPLLYLNGRYASVGD